MNLSRQTLTALAILFGVLIVNAMALSPELSIGRVDLNDNVLHFTLVERMVQAVEHGENPLDCWSPEWSLGYPVLRTYQPLAHLLVVLVYFALFKSVGLMTVFVWMRFLSVALLPLSFFAAARLMGLRPLTAAAASILAPLIATNFLYGLEYGSYTWVGSGLFPQAVGSHFLLIALGLGYRAIRRGRHLALAGAMLGLTFLAHLIYGYMGALSLCLLAVIPDAELPRMLRARRLATIGGVALLLSAFQLAPMLLDGANINRSRWEPVWKWDSFGAGQAVRWLFTGQFLDFHRLPILTLLAFAGAALFIWNWRKGRPLCPAHAFALYGAVLWILLFFGRPFWGPVLAMLGVSGDMQLHRVIGGAQIFLVLLAAIALDWLWRELSQRWHYAAALAATLLLLYPLVQERARNLANDELWGKPNLAAYDFNRDAIGSVIATVKQRGGRAFAGLGAQWGGQFKVGEVPFYAFLSRAGVPAVSYLYHSMALTSDIMVLFDQWNPAHYRLFNIRTVVAPLDNGPRLPSFLTPVGQAGRFQLLAAPGNSYFDVVDAMASVKTTSNNFFEINQRWLQSDWVGKRVHLRLDWRDDVSPPIFRQPAGELMAMPALPSPGEVRSEERNGEVYTAKLEALRPCYALFKMTWHANWKAYVDGRPEPTVMLSPGFVGVPLQPGAHSIQMRYRPEAWKAVLCFAGLAGALLLICLERRERVAQLEAWHPRWTVPALAQRRLRIAAGLALLALPVCLPLFTGSILWGHDAFAYFPRLIEVHRNITSGILIPRWAPDLDRGAGQPLFLFHPPMIYYLGEFWHLLGFGVVAAMNLACAVLVLLSAVAMFLLARLYFGDAGGWLGATAYLYAPYFAVDLYVRSAMEEFAAFPFLALALYGFGAYAKHRKMKFWYTGSAAYACILLCHFPAALLFTPLLLAFLGLTAWMERSWTVLSKQAAGFLLGLGLSAFIWIPALASRPFADMDRGMQGSLFYSNHFVYLSQLFFSAWGYGYSVPGPNDEMSFALGWSHLLIAGVAAIWIWRRPKLGDRRLEWFFGGAMVALCVLMLRDSLWIWHLAPLLQTVQFPWRLLGPVSLCLAMLVAPAGRLLATQPRWGRLGMAAAMALLIVPNLSHLHAGKVTDIDPALWTPQQLSIVGFETTTMAEVTPRWLTYAPAYTPVAAKVISGSAEIRQIDRAPFSWSSPVKAQAASTIEMQTAWFPGWDARVDGQPLTAGPGTPSGLITFQVPAGEHYLEVEYGRTPTEKAAAAISIASLLLAIVLGRKAAQSSPRPPA